MNRILKLGLLSVIVGALYSCSSDSLYDPDKAGDVKLAQYEAAFVGKYGAIAPNQNWGFGGATTRSSNPNSNQWKDFTEVPEGITATEKEVVTEWFKTHQNPQSIGVDWTDFFVQHVSGSHSNMDFLVAASDEHINNFNATEGAIMLMQNSGTSSFGYRVSLDGKMHYNYTIQYIGGA